MKQIVVIISTLVLSLMFAIPAFSQIALEYNFQKGEALKQNMVTDVNLTQKIMGHEVKINLSLSMQMVYEVKDVREDSYTLEMTYKGAKMSTTMPDGIGNMTLDSNTPENIATQQNLSPMLKAIVEKSVEIVISKKGKVESVKGLEKLREDMLIALGENIPEQTKQQIVAQFRSQFSEEFLKAQLEQNSAFFPDKPVNTGDSWNVKNSVTISNFAMDTELMLTLKSIESDVATIYFEGSIFTPEGYEQEVNGAKIKVTLKGTQQGLLKVNKNTGWIISSNITQSFDGNVEAQGMQIPLSVTSISSTTDN